MVQLVDHTFECGNLTVLRSRVQLSFMSLFCICQISHGHVIYNLILWSRNGSTRNLVGMGSERIQVIWSEFGRNLVGIFRVRVKFGWALTDMSFLPFLPFRSDSARIPLGSARNVWGSVKYSNISALDLGREYMPVNADKLFGDASCCGHLTEAREICSGSVKNS